MNVIPLTARVQAVPAPHRGTFVHLILDIAWFGVLNGSAIAFVAVFAARQGATALQLGLLSASPALMTLFFALPAGRWLQQRPISRTVFWASLAHRAFYLLWVILPIVLAPAMQVSALVGLTLLASIPGTILAVGFNALFAAAVPPEWRGQIVGWRNAGYALTSTLVTLFCGWLLNWMPFPQGYQVVFALGFVGAALSSLHLWFIRPEVTTAVSHTVRRPLRDWAQPGLAANWHSLRTVIGLRSLTRLPRQRLWQLAIDGRFRLTLLAICFFHIALYLGNPLFPIHLVQRAQLSDQALSWGNGIFYIALFLGSTFLGSISQRLGHRRNLAIGMSLTCLYPLFITLTYDTTLYLIASAAGGLAWSQAGGALGNYILELIPEAKRPTYLAWYNIALQAGVLIGALLGPFLADAFGLTAALGMAVACRLLAGFVLWRWG
jgi:MFS family permease